jgi:hypothetical protein
MVTSGESGPNDELRSPPTASELEKSEGGIVGHRLDDGRYVVPILAETVSGAVSRKCYFDAAVTLIDGRVRTVAQQIDAKRSATRVIQAGEVVEGLPTGMDNGSIAGVAVHLGNEGQLLGGYKECVDKVMP